MSKKRRTKKEKVIAQTRRESQPQITYSLDPSLLKEDKTQTVKMPTGESQRNDYSYVLKEARNTLMVTSILGVLNLALFFLLQSKMISVPFIGF